MATSTPSQPTRSTDIAVGVRSVIDDVKAKAEDKRENFDRKVSDSPEKAVAIAIGAGFVLNMLPTGRILAGTVGLAAFLVKPTLLALGAVKACELIQNQARK